MSLLGNEKLKELDKLFYEAGTYRSGSSLKELFEFTKNFPYIAPYNAFLIHIQKPGSNYVATAREWQKKYGRTVKPNARPLIILRAFGPVSFVFELEDTEGKPFPLELYRPFQTRGKLHHSVLSFLLQNLPRDGIRYYEADHGTGSAGFIRVLPTTRTNSLCYGLVVNKNLSQEEIFATIAHELGHLYCGHLGTPNKKWWPDRRGLHKNICEFEAESVAWLVCERFGIENPSARYLSGYFNEDKYIPDISLETILKVSGTIESMCKSLLTKRKS